jgi:hypothetical protein
LEARGRISFGLFDRANVISEFQIIALASWKAGAREIAKKILDCIDEAVTLPESAPIFSYWLLHRVSWQRFQADTAMMRQLFKGDTISPPFLGEEPAHR